MTNTTPPGYRVLARKYRPETFKDLVGQNAMVRVLQNAFEANRIAQAFVLTGIRGTGKTTTARIIAKGINCIGPDGTGGPTTEPCGTCEHCTAIMEGRHVDVLEMDAASRTGVADIREIIESVAYRAASARYKIYIIDEVHMLSTSAFNALLKTLEEPPEHVKFIFATTEIRKVPVTVLSRCQRFDLRRLEPEDMVAMLQRIAKAEGAEISEEALSLMVRAAEGSARDATSLLDQAISHGNGTTSVEQVRDMLGLADRGRVLDLFEMIMEGNPSGALAEISAQYASGADPLAILRDLAEITHWLSVAKISPTALQDPTINPDERSRGENLSTRLPMRVLTRMWQMLLKALEEVSNAPNAMMAAEMAIIRLTHVADLPTPGDLVRKLSETPTNAAPHNTPAPSPHTPPASPSASHQSNPQPNAASLTNAAPQSAPNTAQLAQYMSLNHVLELLKARREVQLQVEIENGIRLAAYQPGRIEFTPTESARNDLAPRLASALQRLTGQRWAISLVNGCETPTITETRTAKKKALEAQALAHPMVQTVLKHFPKAQITNIQTHEEIAEKAAREALPEMEDEWDPFEN